MAEVGYTLLAVWGLGTLVSIAIAVKWATPDVKAMWRSIPAVRRQRWMLMLALIVIWFGLLWPIAWLVTMDAVRDKGDGVD